MGRSACQLLEGDQYPKVHSALFSSRWVAAFNGAALEEKINVPNEILFSKSLFSRTEVYAKFVIGAALQHGEVFLWL